MNKYGSSPVPSETMRQLATNHKLLRKQRGLTQVQLADRSGISLGSLKRFERTGQISLESLLKLSSALQRLEDFTDVLKPGPDMARVERMFREGFQH